MIRRTPQEIADFFGCYVAQNEKGRWKLYCAKPIFCKGMDNKIDWDSEYDQVPIMGCTVDVPADHDCKHLYEPQKPDNVPHQSEVFIGERYVLLGEFHPNSLMQKVEEYLNKGFKLYGNPWTGPDASDCGYIHYQAMVRGV